MTREEAIKTLRTWQEKFNFNQYGIEVIDMAIAALESEPCEDAVSRETYNQCKWERDTAIQQLSELGYGLGEQPRLCEDAVSRADIEWHNFMVSDGNGMYHEEKVAYKSQIDELPSAQPDLDEWCTDCKEYDTERHCCPRWNRVIRETLKDAQTEIIRCKDCKWFGDIGCAIHIVDDSDKPTENDFCSFAERRTDERSD